MTTTPHLSLTLVDQSQAQKEVTVNTALYALDAVLNTGAIDKDLSTPPGSPATGDVYIVAASPTGAWSGQAGNIAYFAQAWQFIVPRQGMLLWVNDESLIYVYNGTSWAASPNGEANTGGNLGSGQGVYASKSGVQLNFKSLVAGSNVSLSSDANTVTIAASGGTGSPGGSSGQLQYDNAGAFGGTAAGTYAASGNLFTFQAQADTDVPATVKGHSGTQSGDLFEAQSSTGSVLAKIDHSGNISGANLSGTNTGDQTITLTGDVTGSGTGSFASTIAASAVTTAKISNSAVTYAKIQNESASTLLGNSTGSSAAPAEITLGSTLQFSSGALQTIAHTGDVTTSANSFATTIAAGAVSNAKLANMGNNTIKGNNSGSTAAPSDLTLSQVLDMVGSAAQGDIIYRGASTWTRLGAGTSGQFLQTQGASANPQWASPTGGGTVTSVGLSMPAEFSVSGSPVTGAGTLSVSKASQNANLVYAGPASGAAATPAFRALSVTDLPITDVVSYTLFGGF